MPSGQSGRPRGRPCRGTEVHTEGLSSGAFVKMKADQDKGRSPDLGESQRLREAGRRGARGSGKPVSMVYLAMLFIQRQAGSGSRSWILRLSPSFVTLCHSQGLLRPHQLVAQDCRRWPLGHFYYNHNVGMAGTRSFLLDDRVCGREKNPTERSHPSRNKTLAPRPSPDYKHRVLSTGWLAPRTVLHILLTRGGHLLPTGESDFTSAQD